MPKLNTFNSISTCYAKCKAKLSIYTWNTQSSIENNQNVIIQAK
jgi:hypothetical protein